MTDSPVLKVNYGDMPGMKSKTQLFFKNLEWGINIKSNTMYLTYEIEQDTLYAVTTRFDNFLQHNEGKDINLSTDSANHVDYELALKAFHGLPLEDYTDMRFNSKGGYEETWLERGWTKCKTKVNSWKSNGFNHRKVTFYGESHIERKRVMHLESNWGK